MNDAPKKKEVWGFWATIGLSLGLAVIGIIIQIAAAVIYTVVLFLGNPDGDVSELGDQLTYDGNFLCFTSAVEFPFLIGAIIFFCWLKKGVPVRDYLGFRKIAAKPLIVCIGIMLIVQLFSDLFGILMEQPVPEFMTSVYQSSVFLPALWATVCILAPILEELFFRGFFFEGIARSRLGAAGAVIVTSLVWAVIHLQYDLAVIANLFIYGLVIGTARAVTRSVIPAVAMHVTLNFVSSVQITLLLSG